MNAIKAVGYLLSILAFLGIWHKVQATVELDRFLVKRSDSASGRSWQISYRGVDNFCTNFPDGDQPKWALFAFPDCVSGSHSSIVVKGFESNWALHIDAFYSKVSATVDSWVLNSTWVRAK
ncbi:unnamed protein product [Rotaria sordida]|uniref:Uncharacterized protein n=1 Tax=Rotaria sordida TaxID=392033 RepID=A0A820AU27_9BILA|nr:unnamed protein product [Rotaria sordida]CAF4181794.1 unnamed protein product [Rotaria sordida]